MSKLNYIQNGVTKAKNGRRKRRRRNPATAAAKPAARRNGTTKAGAMSYAKKNGLKLVSRTVANPKRKRHHKRRNGVTATTSRSRNGILGNTKHDVRQVGGVLGGMAATKAIAKIAGNFAGGALASVGVGPYAPLIIEGAVALFIVPMIAKKIGNQQDASNARLGGLAVLGLDLIDAFAPDTLGAFNPFRSTPALVMTGSGPALTPGTVASIVASTDASPASKAAVSGVMRQLAQGGRVRNTGGRAPSLMPRMDLR